MTDINTVTTPSGCLLLIDSRVADYQDIINAKQPGIQHLVFNVKDTNSGTSNPFEYIQTRIAELGVSAYTCVGLVQHNMRMPRYSMFGQGAYDTTTQIPAAPDATIAGVETADPTLQTWSGVSGFIAALKTTYGIQNFDMMACALYSDPNWKYIIDALTAQTGVTIRASIDNTGSASLGGNWFLESHTGVNLKGVYFTEAIDNYDGSLIYPSNSGSAESLSKIYTKTFTTGTPSKNLGATSNLDQSIYVIGNNGAYSAIYTDGRVHSTLYNGSTATVSSGASMVYYNESSIVILKTDGSVLLFGNAANGGSNNTGVDLTGGIISVYATSNAWAALKSNGSVVVWGLASTTYGGAYNVGLVDLTSGVVQIYSTIYAFAALKSNGSVVCWGDPALGGNAVFDGVRCIYSNFWGFSALKTDGSVQYWGGGGVGTMVSSGAIAVYVTTDSSNTYAALKTDGSVTLRGQTSYGGSFVYSWLNINYPADGSISSGVISVCCNPRGVMAALKADGSVICWGQLHYGGLTGATVTSTEATVYSREFNLTAGSGVVSITPTGWGFAALKSNGTVVIWGNMSQIPSNWNSEGRTDAVYIKGSSDGLSIVYQNGYCIHAGGWPPAKTTISNVIMDCVSSNSAFVNSNIYIQRSSYDYNLNKSYYSELDKFNILRSLDYRRAVNLTTDNNNVFTLTGANINRFNPFMPTNKPLRMIIPDYSSTLSLVSTITLPSNTSYNSFIITCEEAERVNINGTIYVNYGTYVYKVESNNTYTKTTTVTIDSIAYSTYGGDGIYSTGIALVTLLVSPTLSNFTISNKSVLDGSFDFTGPTSNSAGAFTFTSVYTSVATISGRTVTIVGPGTATITATQAAAGDYSPGTITASFTVNPITTVLGTFTVPTKIYGTDTLFNLTDPTSNSTGAFTFTSGNTQVATISGRAVTIVGPGTSTITATQAAAGNYSSASTTASLAVGFGNLSSLSSKSLIDGPFVIPTPLSNVLTTYGTSWNKLGSDIVGKVSGDESGTSLSVSADGTIVAIGAMSNTSNRGTLRVYKYNDISWNQLGSDINGEASSDYSGQSVSLSANGRVVAIGANMNDGSGNLLPDSGHVRIYEFNGTSWVQLGGDIDGEANGDQSGISVSLSEDGTIVAIGAIMNDGSGNALSNSGHVRVYKYNSSKSDPQLTNQSLSTFGPAGWDRLGGDIDGESIGDQSGFSVSISANGTIVAIGAIFNDGTSGTADTADNRGHVRVYKYNSSKTDPQLTNQGLTTFGPAGWDRMGSDIDGHSRLSSLPMVVSASGTTVSGIAGGISLSSTGQYQLAFGNLHKLLVSSNYGVNWVETGDTLTGGNYYTACSISSSGQYQSVVNNSGIIRISSDFGKTWSYKMNDTTRYWTGISLSSTGQYQSATINGGTNQIWISSDFGMTWTAKITLGWGAISISATGQYQTALSQNNPIYVSSDFGNNWTTKDISRTSWKSVSVSSTGQYQTACLTSGNQIYLSSDFGNNWTAKTLPASGQWYAVSISSSGQYQTAVLNEDGIYVSSDFGQSWTAKPITQYWRGVSVSSTGEQQTALANSGLIYFSRDYGVTWSSTASYYEYGYQFGTSVSLSADGTAVAIGSPLYGTSGAGSGRVRVFAWNETSWVQRGENINGMNINENVGDSVSLSADGMNLSVSSFMKVVNYNYNSSTSAWTQIGSNITGSTITTITKLTYSPMLYLDATNSSSYNGSTWTNLGSLGGNVNMTYMGAFDTDNSGSFIFNGNGNFGSLSVSSVTLTQTTFIAVVKTSGKGSWAEILDLGNDNLMLGTQGGNFLWAYPFANSSYTLTPNIWYFLAFTISSTGTLIFYVDGISVFTTTISAISRSGTLFGIGAGVNSATSGDEYWNGKISSLAVYSRVLTSTEIASLYFANSVETYKVSLSSQGNIVAIGAREYDGVTGTSTNIGATRVYKIDSLGNYTYTSNNTAIADICGNIILPKSGGSTTITVTQSVSGSNTSKSATLPLTILPSPTFQTYTIASKTYGTDTLFNLVDPSSNSTGAFTFTSGNTQVATISGRAVTIVGPGTSTITATQAAAENYLTGSVTASLVVGFSNLSAITGSITGGGIAIPTPLSNVLTTYGTTWVKRGANIYGEANGDYSGYSVSVSADGTIVAIGAKGNGGYGHVRVYKYNASKSVEQMVQSLANFGPVGWNRIGADIDGEAAYDNSGWSVSLSADGTVVAIGAVYNDGNGNAAGSVRVYAWNNTAWVKRGGDIDGEAAGDYSGWSISLSADGTVVAIGAPYNAGNGSSAGHVRVYKYNANKTSAVTNQSLTTFGPIGWDRLGVDFDGEAAGDESGTNVSLSADGTVLAVGAPRNDGAIANNSNVGQARVYTWNGVNTWVQRGADIDGEVVGDNMGYSVSLSADGTVIAFGSYSISSSSGAVRVYAWNNTAWVRRGADIVGEAAYDESGKSVSLSADGTIVSIGAEWNTGGTTRAGHVRVYKYNSSKSVAQTNQSLANFGPVGWDRLGVDIDGETIYDQSGWSVSLSADGTVVAIGATFNTTGGVYGDAGYVRVYKIDTSGNYTYTSNNTAIADVCGNIVLPKSVGSTTITVTQSASGSYTSKSATVPLAIGFGNLSAITGSITDGPFVIPTPLSNVLTTYGTTWVQRGADIDGEAGGDYSGYSVSVSADGTIVAIGAPNNGGNGINAGQVRIYAWNNTAWVQRGADIDGEAANDYSGRSISISADGTVIAIGTDGNAGNGSNAGHVRVYAWNNSSWVQRGADIDGEAPNDYSGKVSLSADGTVVAIGAYNNYGTGAALGHVRVYKYNSSKTVAQMDQSLENFGPVGWNRIGADIDGEAAGDASGYSVSLSVDGTVVAIGAIHNSGNGVYSGHVRVYKYNESKAVAQMNQSLENFGPVGWNRIGADIDGEAADDYSGYSVSVSADGTIVAIGASKNTAIGSYGGHVRVYAWNNTAWVQRGADIDAEAAGDESGRSVSISTDGTIVAIGARFNAGTAANAGHVRVYKYNANKVSAQTNQSQAGFGPIGWDRIGLDINGEANGDQSGISVSLSADGTVVAIGATGNDGTASDAGHVRVYKIDSFGNYTYTSNNTAIADICGNIILPKSGGSTTITVTQSASGSYTSKSATVPLAILYTPTISTWTIADVSFGVSPFSLTPPTTNSAGAISYISNTPLVATVTTGGVVTVVKAGDATFTLTQEAIGNYLSGTKTGTLTVRQIASAISTWTIADVSFGVSSFSLTPPTSNSTGAISYISNTPLVATVSTGGVVTVVKAGDATFTLTQEASGNYLSGTKTATLTVRQIAPTINTWTIADVSFGVSSFSLTPPTTNSTGAISYISNTPLVATVSTGGVVTVVKAGDATFTLTQEASGNYLSGTKTATLTVRQIAPIYQSISQITKTYSTDVSFSLTSIVAGVSNSSGAYSFSSTSNAIDICGGVATILAYTPSAITITATQDASGNYNATGRTTFTLLVNRKTPSYSAFSIPAKTYGDVSFSAVSYAPTTDSLSVPFTYTSSDTNVATINSNGTVMAIIGQGYSTITASQEASGNYAANSITTSFLVNRAAPTFLKAFTIPNKTFGDASFSLLPFTEGLDNTDGTYHFTSSNAELVSISATDNVTAFIHAYTPTPITIYVAIDACGNYAASSTSGTLNVSRATPIFGTFTVPEKRFRDISFSLTAPTTGSSGAFTYTIDASGAGVATVTVSGVVTVVGAGRATITATQGVSGNFTTRDISASLVVSPIAPTIGALTVPAKNFGDASFNLTVPTTDSSGAFIYTSSDPTVATVTSIGGTVTILKVGTTAITATQDACGNFTTGSVSGSLVVSASLSNFTVPAKKYAAAAFDLTDPTSTDTTVGFTFASSNTAVATIGGAGGRTVSIVGVGSSVITATQAATANRGELNITATLVVSPIAPVITLANITKAYGNSSFRLAPSSTNTDTSGGSVFSFSGDNNAVVSFLDASLLRINGAGTATIAITQTASANFTDSSGSVVITVNKGASGFSASTFAVATNKTYGDASFSVGTAPTSSSIGAITYSPSDTSIATIDNSGVITLVGFGIVNFTASQAESALYTADTKLSNNLSVARKTVALTRDAPSGGTITKTYGNTNFTVSATNESNGTFSYESSDLSFATVNASSGLVHIVAVGTTTITATRAQTAQYTATSVSWTLQIDRGTTTLSGLSSITRNVTVAPFTVSASSASNGAVTYALQDPTSTVLTIHPTSGLVTLLSPGSAVIVASQAQGTLYEAPSSITATIEVTAAANTLQGATLTSSSSFANVNMNGASLTTTNITNTNFSSAKLNNANFNNSTISGATMTSADLSGATLTSANITNTNFSSAKLNNAKFDNSTISGATMTSADLSGASLTTTNITNTNFSSAKLNNAKFDNSTISGATMTSAELSGATMISATITGTDFTSAILRRVDLSGASVRNSIFANADLSGSTLTRLDASGASFINANLKGANLSNAVFTNANMTNANISDANISNVTFTTPQKLQLLKNKENRVITDIQVSQVLGSVLLPVLSAGSAVRDLPNIASATFKVMNPASSLVANDTITNTILDIANYTYFYFPIGENEYFQIEGVKYYVSGTTIRNHATNAVVETSTYGVKAIRLIAGSLTIIVNSQNTLPASSFVVPSNKLNTDAPFGITVAPTSNSSAPIVYTSINTNIATIHPSTGIITLVGTSGFVYFTASQVATETHESASITSNELFVNRLIDFTLPGLNQTFSLSTLATLDASSVSMDATDATAVMYVRVSDMTELFQYQTDTFDINDISSSDLKYYVFHRKLPTELKINPSHAMMNKTESVGMLGSSGYGYAADKSFVKHDFIRYIALRLFNTIHGVDLFSNETDLQENATYLGETVRNNIDLILAGISTTSSSETMSYDASGNKYLTNDASGNNNLCRELMRQTAAHDPSRLYNNGADNAGLKSVPLRENDSILFKLTITSATGQNTLTGVSVIPSRTYTLKLILKNTVTSVTNANTIVTDSDMYPNSYAYSTSVMTYAPTSDSSGVYNVYSPPAPIPFSRFGYNGWYYKNSTTWVNVASGVRDRVKWIVPANTVGSSTVGELKYVRVNMKVFNKTSLPYLTVYTQAGSYRKYTFATPNSLVNGTVYSFYMNFNSYSREPAIIGYTNVALTYSGVGGGSFANNEVVTSIAVESDNSAAASSVEFTLASVVVGEVVSATSLAKEKEYGFSADVPVSYP